MYAVRNDGGCYIVNRACILVDCLSVQSCRHGVEKLSKGTLLCKCMYMYMCSLQVFASSPDHPVWKRQRLPHHGGAHRAHLDMQGDVPKPSRAFSQICDQCEAVGQAQRNSRWCRSSNACHSSSNLLPYQPRRSRASITAPLYKKRMMKSVGRATTNHL